MKVKLLIIALFFASCMHAQEHNLSGYVFDKETELPIAGASILINGTNKGTVSMQDGAFLLKNVSGKVLLVIQFLGYEQLTTDLKITNDTSINFHIHKTAVALEEVEVKGKKEDQNITQIESGIVALSTREMESLPKFMGEADLIKTIKLTPGIQTSSEISSGLHVRGGGAGQNLIVLDDLPLYNPTHLLGIFSVFNSDVIEEAVLMKGGMPANYGGRASSTLKISLKDHVVEKPEVKGSIGLISSKIAAELPINGGKGSFLFGARRTFLGLFQEAAKPILKKSNKFISSTQYYFYDVNAKLSYQLSKSDRVYVTLFMGKDYYDLDRDDIDFANTMQWGNRAISVRWNHIFNTSFSVDQVAGYTDYKFDLSSAFEDVNFLLYTEIEDWFYNLNFNYLAWENHKLKFGLQYTRHMLIPNKVEAVATDFDYGSFTIYHSHELSAYINDEIHWSEKLHMMIGARFNVFYHVGPFEKFAFDAIDLTTDTTYYGKNELIQQYMNPEIRLSFNYQLAKNVSLKSSLSSNTQHVHLASIGSVSLPTDIWLPSTDFIQPERVNQFTLGYFRNFDEHTYETSLEAYYKRMHHQLKFKTGFLNNFDNTTLEQNLTFGDGQSYGIELFIKKKRGLYTGWISYTLSKTTLQFPDLADGDLFFAKYDQRHNLSVVLSREINEQWQASTVFIYTTGNALTLPVGRYMVQGNLLNHYTDINSFRMPAYHRLDLAFSYTPSKKRKYASSWNFGIYNVYNRSNPYYIFFKIQGDVDDYYLNVEAKQVSLFPLMPFVSWTFKF